MIGHETVSDLPTTTTASEQNGRWGGAEHNNTTAYRHNSSTVFLTRGRIGHGYVGLVKLTVLDTGYTVQEDGLW